ncbi:MAG TPA: 4Fe-4S binding protein [Bryobacteraceae bacterium]|nr:4Fe-4S binding protein [Bryobacteraceae bacterium]
MAKKLALQTERCKSCGYCVAQCPKQALSVGGKLNQAGHKHVVLDADRCIACGMCYSVCPDYVFSIVDDEAK